MATKHARPTLSSLVDSDSDEENVVSGKEFPPAGSRKSNTKQQATTKAKITKAKAPSRRTSDRLTTKAAVQKPMRKALADKTNENHTPDTVEVDDIEEDGRSADELHGDVISAPARKGRPTKTNNKQTKKASKSVATVVAESAEEPAPDEAEIPAVGRVRKERGRPPAKKATERVASPEKVIAETQMPLSEEAEDVSMEAEDAPEQRTTELARVTRRQSRSKARQAVPFRRPGSASDTERNDPTLRRKLGDITKEHENLKYRYQQLKQTGVVLAEANYDRLQKLHDQKSNIANKLIESLRADVETQAGLAKNARILEQQLESQNGTQARLEAQVAELTASLKELKAENRNLSTKLAANRSAASAIESANFRMPESVKKVNGSVAPAVRMVGSAEAVQAAQVAQLKEDLYSDLTGLIMRGVKRDSEEDIYDCIQTGRNGTLHFQLAIATDRAPDAGAAYDDAQCVYMPRLDPGRDGELMALLPSYLAEEITFARPQAAKFFARVMRALTEKPEE